ncbi:MAG TPA: hypothetical protein VJ044_07280, partial [Candidatus Hodarchaeales archaeon]|nr:hypothetical protein [Candidatus Hodarchaeales archaeon]
MRGELNSKFLGLIVVDILIEATATKFIRHLEAFADAYPYTLYRARVAGTYSGLYLQFRLPPAALEHLRASLDSFKAQGWISRIEVIEHKQEPIITKPRLEKWDPT